MIENEKALAALKQYFGYDSFREGQEFLVDSLLHGRDVLGVMPTGAGKSICFQLPALLMPGMSIVVSPLISLMKDQVNALTQAGVKAAYLNSSLTARQYCAALQNAANGVYKIIYVAPERLLAEDFLRFAENADISMLTVDEAHCISQWGQDFRPSYVKILEFIQSLPRRPVVSAFTATATAVVREDILSALKIPAKNVLVTGFDRQNLYFEVQKPRDKLSALLAFLKGRREKAGIVYCSTRKSVEEVCEGLCAAGFSATRYHAGLPDQKRHENQEDFIFDRASVMVATNAFGMGIDKSNVSFVVHYNMPKNIESYYQEAGRAGRDGEPADCLLLYSGQDVRTNTFLIDNGAGAQYPDEETERRIKERDYERLRVMTFYCHTTNCLRAYILKYFGERAPSVCGNCGSCVGEFESVDITLEAQKILSCVARAGERYGAAVIIATLRGKKTERLERLGLCALSTFGISDCSENRLHDIINFLILEDFLSVSDGEFPVLSLGPRESEILRDRIPLSVKLLASHERRKKAERRPLTRRADGREPVSVNPELFAVLRALRQEIAAKQSVPAFVIFSDSTLADICMRMPRSDEEFLLVSGVGRTKLERYGERFLSAIARFLESENGGEGAAIESGTVGGESEALVYSAAPSDEPVTVSVIADKLSFSLLQSGGEKISAAKVNTWLIEEGYLKIVTDENGKKSKIPTDLGEALGITCEERTIRGEQCFVNFYNSAAQELVIKSLKERISEEGGGL